MATIRLDMRLVRSVVALLTIFVTLALVVADALIMEATLLTSGRLEVLLAFIGALIGIGRLERASRDRDSDDD